MAQSGAPNTQEKRLGHQLQFSFGIELQGFRHQQLNGVYVRDDETKVSEMITFWQEAADDPCFIYSRGFDQSGYWFLCKHCDCDGELLTEIQAGAERSLAYLDCEDKWHEYYDDTDTWHPAELVIISMKEALAEPFRAFDPEGGLQVIVNDLINRKCQDAEYEIGPMGMPDALELHEQLNPM
ncbi:unnamed protein product [Cladocopium goreaui]|uniref:Uncharacterized protein n=1 Tax=Cladocopium goreaui TaxID=2562237 RepID=A0A9P1BQ92_9DINO|nr:unnamed protein product [Cladocopium goreaui]|mmetsp:Transcript_42851/g.93224  ORF Transcript_42851/g.93224 Transcript_42851/m.93224 type:complete len:182 (+) Transcript_42851:38-583(+)